MSSSSSSRPNHHHPHNHDHHQQRVHVNFRLSLPRPTYAHSVCLYGSWDGFKSPLVMEQDRRVSRTLWKGLYTQDGGLRMGGVYEYYFVIDDHRIIPDPASPGDEVMIDEQGRRYSRLQVPVLAPSDSRDPRRGSAASAPVAASYAVDGISDHQRRVSDPTAARNRDFGYVPAGVDPVRRESGGRRMKTSAEMEMEQRKMEQREMKQREMKQREMEQREMEQREMEQREMEQRRMEQRRMEQRQMEQRIESEQQEMKKHRQERGRDARKNLSSLARGTSKLKRMGSKAMLRFVNPRSQSQHSHTTTTAQDIFPPPPPETQLLNPADTTNVSPSKRRRWFGGFTWLRPHPSHATAYLPSPLPRITSAASSIITTGTHRSSKTPPAGPRPSPLLPPLGTPSNASYDEERHGRCAGYTTGGSERIEALQMEEDEVGDIADDMAELFGYLEHAERDQYGEAERGMGGNSLGLGPGKNTTTTETTQQPDGYTTPDLCSSVYTAEDTDEPDPDNNTATHLPPQFGHRDNSNVTDMNESKINVKPQTRYGNIDELPPPIPGRQVELRELRERVAEGRGRREGEKEESGAWERELAYLRGVVV